MSALAGAAAEGAAGFQKVREVFELEDRWSMRSCLGWKEESWRQVLSGPKKRRATFVPKKGKAQAVIQVVQIDDLRCDGNELFTNTFIYDSIFLMRSDPAISVCGIISMS